MSGKRAPIQRCRLCRCSEYEPCNPPCSWVTKDMCSSCSLIIEAVREWMEIALHANLTGLVREAKAQYAADAVLTLPARKTATRPKRRRRK